MNPTARDLAAAEAKIRAEQVAKILTAYPDDLDAVEACITLLIRARRWQYEAAA